MVYILSKEIIGVTFAVPNKFMNRFFEEGKTVFIKNSKFKNIKSGMKLIFYSSIDVHAFVGEGTIENVEYLTPREVITKYKHQLFLTEKECFQYADQITNYKIRKVSKFLTLALKDIRPYSEPIRPSRFISIGGRYISKSEYKNITDKMGS